MILAHSFVGATDAPNLGLLLHGVLGAGHNLRSLGKKLCERRPDWRFALVDLRGHGKSTGARGPHTLAACSGDLVDLARQLGQSPRAVIGHSLGGKVALCYGLHHEHGAQPLPPDPGALAQIWTLDSDPGAQRPDHNHQVLRVLQALRSCPGPFASRTESVEAIVSTGLSLPLANWLSTSLERKHDGLHWRFELPEIGELLEDYFSIDYWEDLETIASDPNSLATPRYDLLLAENSDRWSGSMRDRASRLHQGGRLAVHTLSDSGHWVHVDNPEGLLTLLADNLVQ